MDLEAGQRASIIGTVYVEMEFKPNILKDLASDVKSPYISINAHRNDSCKS